MFEMLYSGSYKIELLIYRSYVRYPMLKEFKEKTSRLILRNLIFTDIMIIF